MHTHWMRWIRWLLWIPIVLTFVLIIWNWDLLIRLLSEPARLRNYIISLGPLGPLAVITFNALQVVLAPIPGYVIQVAAGYLFGVWWGTVYGTLGIAVGATMAMVLARVYGRPFVERIVGTERLGNWEKTTRADSLFVWFILLVAPVGDIPFYLMGLSRIPILQLLMLTILVRLPSVWISAALGAGTFNLSRLEIFVLFVAIGLGAWLLLRYKDQIESAIHRRLPSRIHPPKSPTTPEQAHE